MEKKEEKTLQNNDLTAGAAATEVASRNLEQARKRVRLLNYLGIGWLVNSASSLYISYNVLPTAPVQKGISRLKDGIYKVMTAAMNGRAHSKQLNYVHDKARSAAEILTMCISGTLLLLPMGIIARNEDRIAGCLDRWTNKDFYKKHPDALKASVQLEQDADEDPVGWGQLIAARASGVATNLTADQMIEAVNNHRDAIGKPNFNTAEWGIGNKVYDSMPTRVRDGLLNFFDRHKAGIDSIQPSMQERLSKVVGNDPKRMVFAEQSRLFQKEFGLTLLLAGVVYAVSTAKIFSKKKKQKPDAHAAQPAPVAVENTSTTEPAAEVKPYSARETQKDASWKQRALAGQEPNFAMERL